MLVLIHVPIRNPELLLEGLVLDSHLTFERRKNQRRMRVLQAQRCNYCGNGGIPMLWKAGPERGKSYLRQKVNYD